MSTPTPKIRPVEENIEEVGCDGGAAEGLGHPLVYLRFEGKREVACYYCGERFAKPAAAAAHVPSAG